VIIVLAALAAYHNCFTVPFFFDDVNSVLENPTIRHLWPITRVLSPPVDSFVGGRPMVNFSLALNYALGGTAVWGYHAFNLAIHVLAGLVLYGIVRRTLLSPVLRERFCAVAMWLAVAVVVLWMVHPLQTEAVTYISQRCELLMGLSYLLTLYCFIRGTESPRSGCWFALSVLACLLGMASKEVMVTAPLMVLLYDRTFVSGSFGEAWRRHQRLYFGLASTWVLLGYLMVGLHYRGAGYGLGIPWWAYALIESRVVVQYLWLAFWPHPLVFDYGEFVAIRHIREVPPRVVIVAVLIASVSVALKRRPDIGLVGAWFFVILAPTSSVVPVVGQPMAEHRMYLPLAAVIVALVIAVFLLGQHWLKAQPEVGGALGWGLSGIVACLLVNLTVQRNKDYRSEVAIWQDTVEKCPQNFRAHGNLGNALTRTGKMMEAIEQYEQALRLKPDFAETYNVVGNAAGRDRTVRAIAADQPASRQGAQQPRECLHAIR
jgi:tetratricopeptide (TPR) repeat protein